MSVKIIDAEEDRRPSDRLGWLLVATLVGAVVGSFIGIPTVSDGPYRELASSLHSIAGGMAGFVLALGVKLFAAKLKLSLSTVFEIVTVTAVLGYLVHWHIGVREYISDRHQRMEAWVESEEE